MPLSLTTWNRIRYTLWAPIYDRVAGAWLQPGRRRSIELLDPRPGSRLLIVGAGTGADLPDLPRNLDIVATDLTPAMVERLRERAHKLSRKVDARVMDAQALEFADREFDYVLLHLIVAIVPDPLACLREAARVLKDDGRIAIFDKYLRPGERPALWRRLANPLVRFLATDLNRTLEPMLEQAGLRMIREEPSLLGGILKVVIAAKLDNRT